MVEKPVGDGVTVFIAQSEQYVCLADGRKIPFDEYREQSRDVIRGIAPVALTDLLSLWIDKGTRKDLRAELKDRDVHVAAFRYFYDLERYRRRRHSSQGRASTSHACRRDATGWAGSGTRRTIGW